MIKNSVLLITAIFGFFLAQPNLAAPITSKPTVPQVLIIGAGISGLAAANDLIKNHIPVLVLEARGRVGGRIFTAHPWGAGLELGASWIHGVKYNPIAELAARKHLTTVPTFYSDQEGLDRFKSFVFHNTQGKELPQVEIQELLVLAGEFEQRLEKSAARATTTSVEDKVKAFVLQKHLDQHTAQLFYYVAMLVYTHEHAADLNLLSVNFINIGDRSQVSGQNVLLPYGYNQILPDLIKDVPLALNQNVKKIIYGPQGVDVYTDKDHFHAAYAIITVPLGVLQAGSIQFSPALPPAKQNSIKKMRMGVYDKVYLLFDKPFWDKDREWIGYAPKNPKETVDIMNYYRINKKPILLIFTAGSTAEHMEAWDNKTIVAHMMKMLRTLYGPSIPNPTAYSITRWHQDPFTHGSYSYLPRGENLALYQALAEPVGKRLFFAGEATSTADPATVHGAYATGLRAAREVVKVMTEESSTRVQQTLSLVQNMRV